MNKEITAEDVIKAIDEMFDDKKIQESETFRQGYNYGILKASQYLVHIQQELQRKDNIINKAIKMCEEDAEAIWEYEGAYSDMFELIKDVLQEKEIKELEESNENRKCS